MNGARPTFTIRGMMIGVVVVAILFALPSVFYAPTLVVAVPLSSAFWARRLYLGGARRAAGVWFGASAGVVNLFYVACCSTPGIHLVFLGMTGLIVVLPTLLSFGVVWASLATREGSSRRVSLPIAWSTVVLLVTLPAATALTAWPFWLRFVAARPALERLADRVAAGQAIPYPSWARPFRIVKTALDPASGNVGLMTDPSPSGPSGFVRSRVPWSQPYGCYRPFRGDWCEVRLGWGWCYHEED